MEPQDIKPNINPNGTTCVCGMYIDEHEEGYVCLDCSRTYYKCRECDEGWCRLIKWGILWEADKNPPYVPEYSDENGEPGFKYVEDCTVFHYECTKCKQINIANCD